MPLIQVAVSKTPSASIAPGTTTQNASADNLGNMVISQAQARYGKLAYDGNLFWASTAAAGVTIPISSATAPTFTLFNSIGSTVNLHLLWISIGITVVTSVASPLLLAFSSGLTSATVPSSTTARAVQNAKLGAGNPAVGQLFTAATITAATTFLTIGHVTATNATAGNSLGPPFNQELYGGILLPPGSFIHVCGTAAQTSPTTISLLYAELPV